MKAIGETESSVMTRASNSFRPPRSIWRGGLALLPILWLALAADSAGQSREYAIKAAFLLNFAQFIQWPASAFANDKAPIVVGVLGDDPFGSVLEQTFQGESVNGRRLVVKRSHRLDDLKSANLLFVSQSEKDRVADILGSLKGASVVTISETPGFAQSGGIINFYIDDNKIRFEVNLGAAQRANLQISSQLLERARIVESDAGKDK